MMKCFFAFFTLLFLGVGCANTGATPTDEEVVVFLSPIEGAMDLASFKALVKGEGATEEREDLKVKYLLERLSTSSHVFVRNGKEYSPQKAMMHLKWKYWKFKNEISNAEGFVYTIANGSRVSGKIYQMKTAEHQYHPMTSIFAWELAALEKMVLQERLRIQAQEEALRLAEIENSVKDPEEAVENKLNAIDETVASE